MKRKTHRGLVMLLLATGCGAAPEEDRVSEVSSKIMGGTEASPREWPWQVQIKVAGGHRCGGTLIDRDWVLTAAHCFPGTPASAITVVAGEYDRSVVEGTEQERAVAEKIIHGEFDPPSFSNDVALLRLAQSVTLGAGVQLVRMAASDDGAGQPALATGWGDWEGGSGIPSILREAVLPIRAQQDCNNAPMDLSRDLFPSEICAGYLDGSKAACGGDSGGPLVIVGNDGRPQLAGITSWGGCDTYAVFARASHHALGVFATVVGSDFTRIKDVPLAGDLDGNGTTEIVIYRPHLGKWYALKPDGTRFFPQGSEPQWGAVSDVPLLGDLDGDGADEMIVWRPSTGKWYARRANGTRVFPQNTEPVWGTSTDVPLVGNVDGSGGDEMIFWRPTTGQWFGLRTDKSFVLVNGSFPVLGVTGDVPLIGNLNGDSTEEIVVWRPNTGRWFARQLPNTLIFSPGSEPAWGGFGDQPLLGNLDSDSADELVIFRPRTGRWHAKKRNGTVLFASGNEPLWGLNGDFPFIGNFNGNAEDLLVWRPANGAWYARNASGGTIFFERAWGRPY